MTGVEYEGIRYDMGNKMGVMQAIVETALIHPEIKDDFKNYLLQIVKEL
jgi:UTP--glucose-1-phosphate uridylyltransferase